MAMDNVTAWYDYPNATNTEDLLELLKFVNTSVEGLFFLTILAVIWFVSFITIFGAGGLNRPAAARGWTFASFLTSILGIFLSIMGVIAPKFMYLPFIMLGLGLLWLKLESPTVD